MKKLITLTVAVISLLTYGCKSTGNLIATTSTTVDHAMQAWAVYVVDGKATPAQEELVRKIKLQYDAAEDAAVQANLAFNNGGSQTAWTNARNYLIEQRNNLLNLVSTLTGKTIQ